MQGRSRIGGVFMHATEGLSSYLSAPSEYVGYRKVILPGNMDNSRGRPSPSVGVWVAGRRVEVNPAGWEKER